ncbi:MAG: L-idonate 5-dehydrogenase [Alsobacter sp.]
MKAVVIHAAHDLRVEDVPVAEMGPREVTVAIERGGICGSDLHYYHSGGFGVVRVKEPMVLGHEIAGRVVAVGAEVARVTPGDVVAVNPSRACNACRFCLQGLQNECLNMLFYGSAMRFPHVQGGFRQRIVCTEAQAVPVPAGLAAETAAFAEPLAVCLHAVRRAGPIAGRRVLVTGCGPIGALCIIAARHAGAAEIVATDVGAAPLALARRIGAGHALDVAADPEALKPWEADKGTFDAVFECSGNARALAGAIAAAAPRARIVQVGLGGDASVPLNAIVAKEIELCGTFRFNEEFDWAVQLLGSGRIDVAPLLSAVLPVDEARAAFDLASDRTKAMKVQLAFG